MALRHGGNILNEVKDILVSQKIGHAYILCGLDNDVTSEAAYDFAASLLCREKPDGFCGICRICCLLSAKTNPDLYMVLSEDRSVGVELIRDLQEDIIKRPVYSDKKVCIIYNGEKMTVQAQNAILKTLENPPDYAVIIITTSNYESMLDTVRSRAVKISFDKGSNVTQTNRLFVDKEVDEALFNLLINSGHETDKADIGLFYENNLDFSVVLDIVLQYYRDFLVTKIGISTDLLINSHRRDIIKAGAEKLSTAKLINKMKAVEQIRYGYNHNANRRLLADVLLLTIQEE